MHADEWESCPDTRPMLQYLRTYSPLSSRKMRLLAAACCRRIWHSLSERGRASVLSAERYADGLASEDERLAAMERPSDTDVDLMASRAAGARTIAEMEIALQLAASFADHFEAAEQAVLLRDLVTILSLPLVISPSWLAWEGGTVRKLAEDAYRERTLPNGLLIPGRLGLLGDALEDAGCQETELLGHLREKGPHVRGCWAIDLLLHKE
jgi:hypothetical protein